MRRRHSRKSSGSPVRRHSLNRLALARTRNLFDPISSKPYKISRSKIELFQKCPRCFYLDRRLGIGQPSGPPFTLNSAVDSLLKREFDAYRQRGEPHPLMLAHGIDAVPFQHDQLETWRSNFVGVQSLHPDTNFLLYGAVDDLWVDRRGVLFVVDYKATSTEKQISLDDPWKAAYKRQMEFYQYLLRRCGFEVHDTGYFVYVNGLKNEESFGSALRFSTHLLPYTGSDDWVDRTIEAARQCLAAHAPPQPSDSCEWCRYRREALAVEATLAEEP